MGRAELGRDLFGEEHRHTEDLGGRGGQGVGLLRVVGGVALIAAGLWWLAASPLGLALAASGVGSILSGAFGYCPACAMVGRKPVE